MNALAEKMNVQKHTLSMSTEILFEEIQGSSKVRNKGLYWAFAGIFAFALVINKIIQKNLETKLTVVLWCGLALFTILGLLVSIKVKLVTQIRSDGIYVRYFPLQFSFIRYPWEEIQEVYVRKYNALTEYLGFGIRIGPMGRGYIVGGDTGLQIIFKDQTKLLITTQRPDEISNILNRLNNP